MKTKINGFAKNYHFKGYNGQHSGVIQFPEFKSHDKVFKLIINCI